MDFKWFRDVFGVWRWECSFSVFEEVSKVVIFFV